MKDNDYSFLWPVGAVTALLFAAAGVVLMFLGSCSYSPLPSRPPTGNHGQGHSPTAACPGQYHLPVEVDGAQYPLTCFGKTAHLTTGLDIGPAVFVEETLEFYGTADGKMITQFIKVPKIPNETPWGCFRLMGKVQVVECFYVQDGGGVDVRSVVPDPVGT